MKTWIKENLGQLLIGVVMLLFIIQILRSCSDFDVDPAKDRLEVINDSLRKELILNKASKDSLYLYIDSLNNLQATIIKQQEIKNYYYKNEVFNILNSDSSTNYEGLKSILKSSDSLFKQGFYFHKIEHLGDTTN